MDVSLGDGGDGESSRGRGVDVALDVALWVDDDRLAGALAADQVAVLGEGGIEDLSEKHGGAPVRS